MTAQDQVSQEVANDLFAIFAREDDDGSYHYTNAEAFDALVYLILKSGMDLNNLPPSLDGVLTRFFDYLNLSGDASPDLVAQKVNAHFEANPLNKEIVVELKRFSEEVQKKSGLAVNEGLAKAAEMLGNAGTKRAPTEDDRPKGPNPMLSLRADQSKKN